jgi:EmrB/QacA subfamily drug resistance transporter
VNTAEGNSATLSRLALATLLVGAFLSGADFFIVNVALQTIHADLRASAAALQLVVAGYGVPYAVLLVLGGRLGDRFGRRRLFLIGIGAFTVMSLACGLAPSPLALIGSRTAQGAAAALMVPQVLATVQATTAGARRARAVGLYAATVGLAGVIGPLAGGALISLNIAGSQWRSIFLVNVPLGALTLLLAPRVVPATRSDRVSPLDTVGALLLGAALVALLVPLTEGRALGWPFWTQALLAAVPVASAAFVLVERRLERAGREPLVPPSLVRLPSVGRGLTLGVLFFAGFGAFMFCTAIAVQDGLGFDAFHAGLTLAPMSLTFMIASLTNARLAARYDTRALITAGALVQAGGLGALIATVSFSWPQLDPLRLAPAIAVAGYGQGLLFSPLFRTILDGVPATRAGAGAGVLSTMQQASLALGVGTLGSLFLSLGHSPTSARESLIVVLAIQVSIAVAVAVSARTLAAETQPEPAPPPRRQDQLPSPTAE